MKLTVEILKNVYGGDGLARLGDGRVAFVPGAIAGEIIKASIVETHSSFVRMRIESIETPSPHRVAAPGVVAPGMVYGCFDAEGERLAKGSQLREFFERARIPVARFVGMEKSPCRRNYRNKSVYHFEQSGGLWRIGYRRENTHEVVELPEDPLARPEINAAMPEIRRHLLAMLTQGAPSIRRATAAAGKVTVRWTSRSGVKWWIGEAPAGLKLMEETCGRVFEVPAGGFYQVNPAVGEELVRTVKREFNVRRTPALLDLYCGVGVFGLICRPESLVGVESGREAVAFAKANALREGMPKAQFVAGETGRSLRRLKIDGATSIIVDPPRSGMEPGVARFLARSGAPYIYCISCDPATMMRDLRVLHAAYSVESVQAFDMFPSTASFETLAVLRRKNI